MLELPELWLRQLLIALPPGKEVRVMCELCRKREGATTALVGTELLWVCSKCFIENGCK